MKTDPLAKYNFTDDHGHPIANCVDYIALVVEVEGWRDIAKGNTPERMTAEQFAFVQSVPDVIDAVKS